MTNVSSAEISVIIVNYNTADLVLEGIQSVLDRNHGGRLVDIHLVDNASPNGDCAVLESAIREKGWRARVTLYAEPINHGFGRGNNLVLEVLAARSTPPEFVFLLNPDARLENEALDALASFMAEHPKVGAAGARIEKPGGVSVTAAFRFPVMLSEFSKGISFGPICRAFRKWDVPLGADLPTGQVGWVAGAAVMFRFSALLETGFFDPDYFLYYEEVDLMKKLSRHGWSIWYVTQARVIHAEGAASGVKSGEDAPKRRPAYWYESWRLYFQKNHGRAYALTAGGLWMLGDVMNKAISSLRCRKPAAPPHFLQDIWNMGIRPLLGLKARPYDK